jgi:hypothetical protein
MAELYKGEYLKITEKAGQSKVRKITNLFSGGDGAVYGVHNSNLRNAERAVMERVFFVKGGGRPPLPNGRLRTRLGKIAKQLKCLLPTRLPIDHEEFLEYYRGSKLQVYRSASESLVTEPLTKKDSQLASFIKAEKVLRSKDGAPRLIQPRSPRFNIELGCYLKPLEHDIYSAINTLFGGVTVAKGLNALERGERIREMWDSTLSPVCIGLDASRFDQHVSQEALRLEHSIYLAIYNQCPKLANLLSQQLINKGVVRTPDGTIRYTVRGMRASGDMNTALGNVLLMCLLIKGYSDSMNIPFKLLNDGDDCVIVVSSVYRQKFLDHVVKWFKEVGFTMKIEGIFTEFNQIEFCQSKPIFTGQGTVMVRNPHTAIHKDNVVLRPLLNQKEWDKARSAIAGCGLALSSGVPVMESFYLALGRSTSYKRNEMKKSGMDYLADGMVYEPRKILARTRFEFEVAFDINPMEQRALEEHYRRIKPHYQVVPVNTGSQLISEIV